MSIVTCQKPPWYRRRHEGCAEELASLTAALSVGRVACRGGGMIDGVGIRGGRVMHTAVASSMRSQPGVDSDRSVYSKRSARVRAMLN
jgi:hypothetical protein